MHTEVMDVNPLNGRDTYAGKLHAATTSADFLFGLRIQYELSTFFITNLGQSMHFAYIQDDCKILPKLTVNVGMRYEYGSPQWERGQQPDQLRSCDGKTMIKARSGSIVDRALVDPDLTDFGPRARDRVGGDAQDRRARGLRDQLHPLQPFRLRQPAAHQCSSGDLRRGQPDSRHSRLPDHTAGLPGRTGRPGEFRSRYRQRHLHAVEHPRHLRAELALLRSAKIRPEHDGWMSPTSATAPTAPLLRRLQPGAAEPPGQTLSIAQRQNTRPFPTFGDITIASNGAFSDYHACKSGWSIVSGSGCSS